MRRKIGIQGVKTLVSKEQHRSSALLLAGRGLLGIFWDKVRLASTDYCGAPLSSGALSVVELVDGMD